MTPDVTGPLAAHDNRSEPPGGARVVLLPVDPYLIHAYWTVSPENIAKARLPLGKDYERAEAVLRFHDAAPLTFGGSNVRNSFDVRIDLNAPNWYVHLRAPEKSYCADLGLRTEDGRFFSLARSNVAEMPRSSVSTGREAYFVLVEGNYERGARIPNAEGTAGKEEPARDKTLHSGQPIFTGAFTKLPEGNPGTDLTEMSERAFVHGLSSTLPSSSPDKTSA